MIDLDNFTGSLSKLLQLHPRALVQTSRQSYQLWLTLDQRHQARDAQIVTQELTKALGGDPCSARITQVGRLPGSINRKPEKQCHTHLLYSGLANLDEAQYLQLTSNPQMRLQHGSVQTDSAPPKRDISRDDWREACHFFESNPQATLEDAIQHCPLLAKRGNQAHPTGFLTIVYRFCSQPSYITFNKSCLILPMCDNRYFTLVMLPSPCFIASSRCALRDLCFTHHSVRTTTPDWHWTRPWTTFVLKELQLRQGHASLPLQWNRPVGPKPRAWRLRLRSTSHCLKCNKSFRMLCSDNPLAVLIAPRPVPRLHSSNGIYIDIHWNQFIRYMGTDALHSTSAVTCGRC